jgi:hypothetical protein
MGHVSLNYDKADILDWLCLPSTIPRWAVIPVNMEGVMGAGLAQHALKRFPMQCNDDIAARREQAGRPSEEQCLVRMYPPLIFFPTKYRWRDPSLLELIEASLHDLAQELVLEVRAFKKPVFVAMPHIGCGLGGLKWETVQPLVEQMVAYLSVFPLEHDITITVVEPA